MRGRLLILVGLIVLVAAIALFVVLSGVLGGGGGGTPGPTLDPNIPTQPAIEVTPPTPIPLVEVVIALQNLPRGYRFPTKSEELANVVGYFPYPEQAVPFNALRKDQGGLEKVLGQVARTDIYREQPLLSTLLVPDLTKLANVGSDAAAVLPSDRVAVSIPVDRVTSVAYGIRDGDRVDIIISMLFVDVDQIFQSIVPNNITLFNIQPDGSIQFATGVAGRPDVTSLGSAIIGPSERQRPRLVTQRTIQDALVVRVGNFPLVGSYIGVAPTPTPVPQTTESEGGGTNTTPPPPPTPVPPPDIVTLGVSPQNAVVLVWAIEAKLPLTLALRSATDTSRVNTTPVTLDYILSQFNITVPGKRDYTIEPAIRSIRQLLAGQEISLAPG